MMYDVPPIEPISLYAQNTEPSYSIDHLMHEMQQIDKVELHLHLGGAWPLEYIKSIADPTLFASLTTMIDTIEVGMDYHQVFQVFDMVNKLVDTDQKVEDGVVALCKKLAEDRVTYVEIRTGLKDLGSGLQGYLDAVLRGIERAKAEFPVRVGLVLSLRRDSTRAYVEQVFKFIDQYHAHGVVGLDVSGDSTKGDGSNIFEALQARGKLPVPITLHLGESPQETAEQQLKELQLLNPVRIGHAVHLHPEAWHWIRMRAIPLELCITSAVAAGMITHEHQHPALRALQDRYPVVICTDDPLIFKTSLSRECAKVAALLNLSSVDIRALQDAAQRYLLVGMQSLETISGQDKKVMQKNVP